MSPHHKSMVDENENENESIWIFAYGSLCWRPGFEYEEKRTGFINGWKRKFYQGNIVHRGSASKPGRVATIVTEEGAQTWGCAYRIGKSQLHALDYLRNRESSEGGYECVFTVFYPELSSSGKQYKGKREGEEEKEEDEDDEGVQVEVEEEEEEEEVLQVEEKENDLGSFPCLCYAAFETNSYWLGKETEENIAEQVRGASGENGSNVEYVLSLHKYMRTTFPFIFDEHLEKIVRHL